MTEDQKSKLATLREFAARPLESESLPHIMTRRFLLDLVDELLAEQEALRPAVELANDLVTEIHKCVTDSDVCAMVRLGDSVVQKAEERGFKRGLEAAAEYIERRCRDPLADYLPAAIRQLTDADSGPQEGHGR